MPDTDLNAVYDGLTGGAPADVDLNAVAAAAVHPSAGAQPVVEALAPKITPATGDAELRGYAERAASAAGLQGDEGRQYASAVHEGLRSATLQRHVENEQQRLAGRYGNKLTPEYLAERSPVVGSVFGAAKAVSLADSAARINAGQGRAVDYQDLARRLAEMKHAGQVGDAEYAFDLASQLPKEAIEWLLLSGATKGAGKGVEKLAAAGLEKAGASAAEGAAGKALGAVADYGTRAAVRTGLRQDKTLAGTLGRMQGSPVVDEKGRLVNTGGEAFPAALTKTLADEFISNLAFEAMDVYTPKTGFKPGDIGLSTLKAVGAAQGSREASYRVGAAPEGSVLSQFYAAKDADERKKVLSRGAAELVVFAGLETGMHGIGGHADPQVYESGIDKARKALKEKGLSEGAADRVIAEGIDRARAQQPPAEPQGKGDVPQTQPGGGLGQGAEPPVPGGVGEAPPAADQGGPPPAAPPAAPAAPPPVVPLAELSYGELSRQAEREGLRGVRGLARAELVRRIEAKRATVNVPPAVPAPEAVAEALSEPRLPGHEASDALSLDTLRAALRTLGYDGKGRPDAAKMPAEAVKTESRRLGLDKAEVRPTEATGPQKAATYEAPDNPTPAPEAPGSSQAAPEPVKAPEATPDRLGRLAASQGPRQQVAGIFKELFPEGKAADKPERPGEMQAEVGGRPFFMSFDPTLKAARIDFDRAAGKAPIEATLQPGTLGELVPALRSAAEKVKAAGLDLAFSTDPRRAAIYKRQLEKLGFELVREGPDPRGMKGRSAFVFRAKEAAPGAPRPAESKAPGEPLKTSARQLPEVPASVRDRALARMRERRAGLADVAPRPQPELPGQRLKPSIERDAFGQPVRPALADAIDRALHSGDAGTFEEVAQNLNAERRRKGLSPIAERDLAVALDTLVERGELEAKSFGPKEPTIYVPGDRLLNQPFPTAPEEIAAEMAKIRAAKAAHGPEVEESINADRELAKRGGADEASVQRALLADLQKAAQALRASAQVQGAATAERGAPGEAGAAERGQAAGGGVEELTPEQQAAQDAETQAFLQQRADARAAEKAKLLAARVERDAARAKRAAFYAEQQAFNAKVAAADPSMRDRLRQQRAASLNAEQRALLKDQQDRLSRNAPERTVLAYIRSRGGLSRGVAEGIFGKDGVKAMLEDVPTLFRDDKGRNGSIGWDNMADEIVKWYGEEPGLTPFDQLWKYIRDGMVWMDQGIEKKIEAEQAAYYRDQERLYHAALAEGIPEEQVRRDLGIVEAEGSHAGEAEGHERTPEEVHREVAGDQGGGAHEPGDAAEPTGGADTGFDFGALAGSGVSPEGMGAAGGGGPSGPRAGAPGAASAYVPERGEAPMPASSWFRELKDQLKSFAQQSLPSLTRLSEKAGEKLAAASNARHAADAAWDYYSRVIKAGDKSLADLTDAEARLVGTVWLERRMRAYAAKLLSMGLDNSHVRTFVGQTDSPLATEADYQEGLRGLFGFFEAVKQEWTPEVDGNYRGLKGLQPGDAIDSPSQLPGLPLNAIAVTEEGVPGAVGPGRRQGMENLHLRKPGFARKAELDAPAYDTDVRHMMKRTLDLGIPAARRAEFARAAIADGVLAAVAPGAAPPEGFRYLALDPAKGLPGLDPAARYYAHPEAFRDVVQGLGIAERPGQTLTVQALRMVTDKLYNVALMSPVELATHMANHMTALFRPGMGVPLVNLKDTFRNAWDLYKKDPELLRKVKELAAISASFGHEAKPGILGEGLRAYDPTAYVNRVTSGLIDVMQKAVRVQLGDAYDRLQRQGSFPDSDTAKRDFINQAVGNYNTQAGNRLTQFLKDTGLQSFATAAHTFTVQGVKSVWGGAVNAPAMSAGTQAKLRGLAVVKMLPFLAAGPVINALAWGQAFPAGVPAFAVKTREDDKGVHYYDPLVFTGLRRGARATGVNALVEGQLVPAAQGRPRDTAGETGDRAVRDAARSLEHLFAGPPAQFIHTAATGEDATGRRVAPQVSKAHTPAGDAAAARKGLPPAGSSQYFENLKAASAGVNPAVKTYTTPDGRDWWDNLTQSAGPFAEKYRAKPKTPAERRRLGFK